MTADTVKPGVLPRRLGFVALTFLIVAWNAPIAAMAGFRRLAVGFGNGIGAPVSFIVAGLILAVFAVGFIGMTPHVKNPGPSTVTSSTDSAGRPASAGRSSRLRRISSSPQGRMSIWA